MRDIAAYVKSGSDKSYQEWKAAGADAEPVGELQIDESVQARLGRR